ncbi:MAG TPA: LytTR family DNA-binding domain-containing protein [Candidatus Dormibacteraeota bacterium]|nr:LytTR family DNA-binding domain-containing protein [Candidatus Dormibacteraeota bacterium]
MRLLIVDHEPLARANLALLCELKDGVAVVGEADSGRAAITAAEQLHPDVIVLDTQLPDMTGLEVLREARRTAAPLGIMVTAHPEQAPPLLETGVIDCLVKPIHVARFTESIERARRCYRSNEAPAEPARRRPDQARTLPAAAEPAAGATSEPRPLLLVGEREHRLYVLRPEQVQFIKSHGNYVRLHAGNTEYISRDSVKHLADLLAGCGFLRIERSLLINTQSILYAQRSGRGTYAFTLANGACLYSGPTYRDEILRVLPLASAAPAGR